MVKYGPLLKPITNICLNLTDACNLACVYCVPAGTQILMADGTTKNIEKIKLKDLVIGTELKIEPQQQRTIFPTKVVHLIRRTVDEYLKIYLQDGKILTLTPNHPVLNGHNTWVEAKNLQEKNDYIISLDYKSIMSCECASVFYNHPYFFRDKIEKIETIYAPLTVYNISTESNNYIANGLVVHNCFVQQKPNYITLDTAKQTLHWLHENNEIVKKEYDSASVPAIVFFGGEPTLLWDQIIVPLVEYSKEQNLFTDFSMTSNGTLLTKDKVDFLVNNNMGLMLSCDGDKLTQDYNRPTKNGTSSFNLLYPNLNYIISQFPNIKFRSTLIPKTAQYIFDNIMFAKDQGFKNIQIEINQFEEWPKEIRETVNQEIEKYTNYIIDCVNTKTDFISLFSLQEAFRTLILLPIYKRFLDQNPIPFLSGNECFRCGMGNGFGSINYKGDIFSCQEMPSRTNENEIFYLGNIFTGIEQSRIELLQSTFLNRVKTNYNFENEEKCKNCSERLTCRINYCPINSYIKYKDFGAIPDAWCWWQQLMMSQAQILFNKFYYTKNEFFMTYLQKLGLIDDVK